MVRLPRTLCLETWLIRGHPKAFRAVLLRIKSCIFRQCRTDVGDRYCLPSHGHISPYPAVNSGQGRERENRCLSMSRASYGYERPTAAGKWYYKETTFYPRPPLLRVHLFVQVEA